MADTIDPMDSFFDPGPELTGDSVNPSQDYNQFQGYFEWAVSNGYEDVACLEQVILNEDFDMARFDEAIEKYGVVKSELG